MQKLGHSNNPSDTSLRQTCEISTYHLRIINSRVIKNHI